jgi:hypothetical protein
MEIVSIRTPGATRHVTAPLRMTSYVIAKPGQDKDGGWDKSTY